MPLRCLLTPPPYAALPALPPDVAPTTLLQLLWLRTACGLGRAYSKNAWAEKKTRMTDHMMT